MIRIGFDVLQLGAMCALLCGAMYGTTISPNLVPNGGFETGVEKWAWSQWRGLPAPGGLDTENAFKGQACYRLSLPGEARERFINSHTFAVPEKRNFEFSITLACENVPKNALTVQILQWGTEKTEKPHPQGWVCVPANHGDGDVVKTGGTHPWKTFTVKIPAAVIKPSTKKLSVYIRHKAAGIGVAWADAVSLIATGAGAPAQPAAPSKPEAKAAKPEAKAAKPEVEKKTGSDRNLLPGDTSFETGSGGWRGASADTATASHGSRSLILAEAKTCRSPKYYGLIKADTPYSFSFSAMTDQPRIDIMVDLWHLRYKIMKRKTFRLSREWRRFTVPVPPQTVDRNFYAVITRQGA